MKQNQTLKIVLIALFAALVCVATMLVPIPIPSSGGYANACDCVILMFAFLMGPVNAAFAAGIGSMLADLLLGYVSFAPGTLVIKACVALIAGGIFNRCGRGQATWRALGVQLIGGVAAEAFMVLGYFFYEAVLLGVGIGAAGGIAANIGQGAVGIVIAAVLTPLLSHAHEVRELMDKIRGAK